ncbi:MAG: hypothetical protein AAF335_02785, partial [Bacteroidota bacterium]
MKRTLKSYFYYAIVYGVLSASSCQPALYTSLKYRQDQEPIETGKKKPRYKLLVLLSVPMLTGVFYFLVRRSFEDEKPSSSKDKTEGLSREQAWKEVNKWVADVGLKGTNEKEIKDFNIENQKKISTFTTKRGDRAYYRSTLRSLVEAREVAGELLKINNIKYSLFEYLMDRFKRERDALLREKGEGADVTAPVQKAPHAKELKGKSAWEKLEYWLQRAGIQTKLFTLAKIEEVEKS